MTLLRSQAATADTAVHASRRQHEDLEESIRQAAGRRDALAAVVLEIEMAHAQAAADVDRMQGERLQLLDEQGHSEKSLAAMRDQRVAWEARIHVLEELERRQEGLGLGVQEILRRAAELPERPWNRILGCVGELLDVPLEHAPLLEVALGTRAQMLVTSDMSSLVEYLNHCDGFMLGRVGFLELSPAESGAALTTPPMDVGADLSCEPGIVTRADRLVVEPEQVRGLAARLLSNTWIVETLEVARRIWQRSSGRTRCVTLQGELVDVDGALYAGTVPDGTSVVSRKSELRRLRAEVRQLDGEMAEQLQELTALGRNLTGIDQELAVAENRRQMSGEQSVEARLELADKDRELERLTAERDRVGAAMSGLIREHAAILAELERVESGVEECQNQMAASQAAADAASGELEEIERTLQEVHEETKREQLELATHEERGHALRDAQQRLERDQTHRARQLQQATERLRAAHGTRQSTRLQILDTQSRVAELFARAEQLDAEIAQAEVERTEFRARRSAIHRSEDELHAHRRRLSDACHACELQIRESRHQVETLQARIEEEYQLHLPDLVAEGVSALNQWKGRSENGSPESDADDPAADDAGRSAPATASLLTPHNRHHAPAGQPATGRQLTDPEVRGELESEVQRLRRKLKAMGHVNTEALESLDELETRFGRLSGQLQDLTEARSALEEIIRRINAEGRRMFLESFESIRGHFRELFRKLFGGGEADIVLEDPNDVLECGIDIVARPPGKELRSITLLSGGEKTLTAIALLFAMFRSKPSPYCILDEVDAALDEANVERYASILKDFVQMTQFVVITHRKRTMTAADVIYGVTMEQAGVSKRMSVRFEEVAENGEIRTRGGRAA